MKHCDFYFFETLRNVFQKYSGRSFYQTLRNVSNIKKFQCLTETSNSSLSKKDLAIFRGKTMLYIYIYYILLYIIYIIYYIYIYYILLYIILYIYILL